MTGKRLQSRVYANRTHARTTASCGIPNVLCKFKWQTSTPNWLGLLQTNLGVHVGTIHVNHTTRIMDKLAQVFYPGLKDAMSRGIGYHQCSNLSFVLFNALFQLATSMFPCTPAVYRYNREPCHNGAGWIGSMSACWYQVAMSLFFTF